MLENNSERLLDKLFCYSVLRENINLLIGIILLIEWIDVNP